MSLAIKRLMSLTDATILELAHLLIACVEGGASVGFMRPLSLEKAFVFWRGVADGVERQQRALILAEEDGRSIGTVQLLLNLPENQPHRADLSKMLVHPLGRRHGVGAALLRAAEELALGLGKSLLVLDTASADAERLYLRLGWLRVGVIPDYALLPGGGFCATTFFYRRLARIC
jgi:GNAT superfamily N-acetyltransferase